MILPGGNPSLAPLCHWRTPSPAHAHVGTRPLYLPRHPVDPGTDCARRFPLTIQCALCPGQATGPHPPRRTRPILADTPSVPGRFSDSSDTRMAPPTLQNSPFTCPGGAGRLGGRPSLVCSPVGPSDSCAPVVTHLLRVSRWLLGPRPPPAQPPGPEAPWFQPHHPMLSKHL